MDERFSSNLYQFLISLGADPADFDLRDDGRGPWIHDWRSKISRPTPADEAKWAETYVAPAEPDHVAEVDAKLEAAKAGTQGDKIIALRESVEALTAALKARGVL